MSQAATTKPADGLSASLALIDSDLARVEQALHENLRSDVPIIRQMIANGSVTGGKRFRPILLLLTAKAVGTTTPQHILAAAAIEMIHAATLVHDDVIDGAGTRRHRPTINSRWDTHHSVLFGDYLFTHAFYLASTTGDALVCQTIGRATNAVCEGELQQAACSGCYELSEQAYMEIIKKKTSALCACSTGLGAHLSGASIEEAVRWEQVGERLGTAFQIIDDVLDLKGSQDACGKTLGTDLQTATPTLPVILALRQASSANRVAWTKRLNDRQVSQEELACWLHKVGALDGALSQAQQLVADALRDVTICNADARACFEEIGDFLLHRSR